MSSEATSAGSPQRRIPGPTAERRSPGDGTSITASKGRLASSGAGASTATPTGTQGDRGSPGGSQGSQGSHVVRGYASGIPPHVKAGMGVSRATEGRSPNQPNSAPSMSCRPCHLPFGRLGIKRARSREEDELALDNFMSSKRYLSALMASSMTNLRLADIRTEAANGSPVGPTFHGGIPGTPNGSSGSIELRSSSPMRETPSVGHRSPSPYNEDSPRSAMSDDSTDSGTWGNPDTPATRLGMNTRGLPRAGSSLNHQLHQHTSAASESGRPPLPGQFLSRADQSLGGVPEGAAVGASGAGDRRVLRHGFSCSNLDQMPRTTFAQRLSLATDLPASGANPGSPAPFPRGPLPHSLSLSHSQSQHLWGPGPVPSPRSNLQSSLWRNSSEVPGLPPIQVPRPTVESLMVNEGVLISPEMPTSPSDRNSAGNLRKAALMRAQHKQNAQMPLD